MESLDQEKTQFVTKTYILDLILDSRLKFRISKRRISEFQEEIQNPMNNSGILRKIFVFVT